MLYARIISIGELSAEAIFTAFKLLFDALICAHFPAFIKKVIKFD